MSGFFITTFDWVPENPRGFVRDLRVRWALEEAGLPYRVATAALDDRDADHLVHQPFVQVPWLTNGDTTVCESGAILLYLGERSAALMPAEAAGRAAVVQWVFAAPIPVETAVIPWALQRLARKPDDPPPLARLDAFLAGRLERMEPVVAHGWLAGDFSIADLLMADVLRLHGAWRPSDQRRPSCPAHDVSSTLISMPGASVQFRLTIR